MIESPKSSSSSQCYRHNLQHVPIIITSLLSWSFLHHRHCDHNDCITNRVIIITSLSSLPSARPHPIFMVMIFCRIIILAIIMIASPTSSSSSHRCHIYLRHVPIITLLSSWSLSRRHHCDHDLYHQHRHHHIVIVITSRTSPSSSHHYRHDLCRIIIIMTIMIASPTLSSSSHYYRHYFQHVLIIIITSLLSWSLSPHRHHDRENFVTNIIIIMTSLSSYLRHLP